MWVGTDRLGLNVVRNGISSVRQLRKQTIACTELILCCKRCLQEELPSDATLRFTRKELSLCFDNNWFHRTKCSCCKLWPGFTLCPEPAS